MLSLLIRYSNPFRIRIFLFLSYSFGTGTINTFIRSVVPSKTIPDSRPKWAKSIPVFRLKRRGTYLHGLYKEVPQIVSFPDEEQNGHLNTEKQNLKQRCQIDGNCGAIFAMLAHIENKLAKPYPGASC